MKTLKEYDRYIIYGLLIVLTVLVVWSISTKRPKSGEGFTRTKWEYGVYNTMNDICYKWCDADKSKSVFSTKLNDFYRKMGLPSDALLQDLLNLLGTQGWELVCVSVEGTQNEPASEHSYYFKRPK
jgi:hypothetical protein